MKNALHTSWQALKWVMMSVFVLLAASCTKDRLGSDLKSLQLLIEVPPEIAAGVGDEVTFNYEFVEQSPRMGDMVVFQKSRQEEYACPVTHVDAVTFSFRVEKEIPVGTYLLLLRRGGYEIELGETLFDFIPRNDIEKKEGFNLYGQVTCEGKGVPGVVVSDGVEVTRTDEDGVYYLDSHKKYRYVWMSIPSGYEALSNGVLPLFCNGLHSPESIQERVDFELVKSENDQFTMYVLGDMHLAKRNQDLKQFDLFVQDLNETIRKTPGKEYVLTLGDMTWDLYWYTQRFGFKEYLQVINNGFQNIQFFHTMGNHDNDYEQFGDFDKEIAYCRFLTPTFYSYNIGKFHFIVMDNIDYNDVGAGMSLRSLYEEDITADQMKWLEKDLSYVSKDTPVIFSTHAPLFRPNEQKGWVMGMNGANSEGEANTAELVKAFKGYTVHFFTGHTHKTFVYDQLEEQQFMEHNAGSICGSWWWSGYLTPYINLSQDGAPGGYTILKIDGKDLEWTYKSTGYPDSYQFRSYDMNEVKKVVTMETGFNKEGFYPYVKQVDEHGENIVLLNIWNHDPQWKVSVTENGRELEVEEVYDYDPLHIIAMTAKRFATSDNPDFLTNWWPHFFSVQASSPSTTLEITVTDRFGKVYRETMRRPKAFNTHTYLPQ